MTEPMRKKSFSLPGDVAARLEQEDNASAYVASAVRDRMRLEQVDEALRAAGITVTETGVARARAERAAVEAQFPRERRDAIRARARAAGAGDGGQTTAAA